MGWADSNYNHKKEVTIANAKVAGNEDDFPVLIKITDTDLQGCLANGYDIKFYESTESTQLKHERVFFDNSTGELLAWVKIPSLSGSVDTVFYMYYEYPSETVDQADPENTWDDHYMMVQHMQAANWGATDDSTSNNNDADGESGDPTYQQTGKIRKCVDFDGSDYIRFGGAASLKPTNVTIEAWGKRDASVNARTFFQMPYDDGGDWNAPYVAYGLHRSAAGAITMHVNHGGTYHGVTDGAALTVGEWYHLVGTFDGSTITFYKNGSDVAHEDYSGDITYSGTPLLLVGMRSIPAAGEWWIGGAEELRISDILRSANWISTEYESQNDPANFMGFGSEESPPPVAAKIPRHSGTPGMPHII